MKAMMQSATTAGLSAAGVLVVAIWGLAPHLPPVVGAPSIRADHALDWPAAKRLRLRVQDGFVRIRTHSLSTIRAKASVTAYALRRGEDAAARQYAETIIQAEHSDDVLAIETEPGTRPEALELYVDYSILVPEGTDVEILGANGNVWVSRGCGEVVVNGTNADIEIVQPRGTVVAKSTNGRVRVIDAQNDTNIETVNGNVYAHMLGGKLTAATTNGHIEARVLEPDVGNCELNTTNGGITLVLREHCSARVHAQSANGIVQSDWPIDTEHGVHGKQVLQGRISTGRTQLTMHTVNGNIWIAKEDS
jgi:hypothetical protein